MTLETLFGVVFISVVWALILYYTLIHFSRRHYSRRTKHTKEKTEEKVKNNKNNIIDNTKKDNTKGQTKGQMKYLLFLAFGVVLVYACIIAYSYFETPEFCGSCHSMQHEYETYKNPGNSIMGKAHLENETSCSDCHNSPGLAGAIYSKGKGAFWAVKEYTGTANVGDAELSNENCIRCHDELRLNKKIEAVEGEKEHYKEGKKCYDCHTVHSGTFGFSKKGCLACHNMSEEQLQAHETTTKNLTGKDCNYCHENAHPYDIAYNEYPSLQNLKDSFCLDCHADIYSIYMQETYLVDNYGGCLDCHISHDNYTTPHITTSPYDKCQDCHKDYATYSVHTKNISYDSVYYVTGDFCKECHQTQYLAYYGNATQETFAYYGECTDCHSTHAKTSVPHSTDGYAACYKCHESYDIFVQIHNPKPEEINYSYYLQTSPIPNSFCANCHETQYHALYTGIHSSLNCTDCHIYHRDTQPNCKSCHTTHTGENYEYPYCIQCHDVHTTGRKES